MMSAIQTLMGVAIWLKRMTAEEKRLMQQRAAGAAVLAAGAVVGAPQVAHHAAEQQVELAFRTEARELAVLINRAEDGNLGVPSLTIDAPLSDVQLASQTQDAFLSVDNATLESAQAFNSSPLVQVLASVEARTPHAETSSSTTLQHLCMAEAIYYEARSEDLSGQLAVAEVVLNRVSSKHYPSNICGVVYQGAQRTTGCQFSFTCDGSLNKAPRGEAWDQSLAVAGHVMMGLHDFKLTGDATHYHTNYVAPYWRAGLIHTETIGTHIFYRFPETGREWKTVRVRMAAAQRATEPALTDVALTTDDLQARELARLSGEDV